MPFSGLRVGVTTLKIWQRPGKSWRRTNTSIRIASLRRMAPHSSRQPITAIKYLITGRRIECIEVQRYRGDNIPGDIWVDMADGAMWERGDELFDTYEEAARVVIAAINDEIRGLIAERKHILQQCPGRRIGEQVHTTSLARTLGNQGV